MFFFAGLFVLTLSKGIVLGTSIKGKEAADKVCAGGVGGMAYAVWFDVWDRVGDWLCNAF
mgnify:CR=1 FL=1